MPYEVPAKIELPAAALGAKGLFAEQVEACDMGVRLDGSEFPVEALVSRVEAVGRDLFTVIVRDITECREHMRMIRRAHEETVHRLLAASSFRDYETGAHVRRTGLFSEVLAIAAGWDACCAERLPTALSMEVSFRARKAAC